MTEDILKEIAVSCMRAAAVPVSHLSEFENELESLHAGGLLEDGFYTDLQPRYCFSSGDAQGLPTVMIVALPSPLCRLTFHCDSRKLDTVIPPTYRDFGTMPAEIEMKLNGILQKYGLRAVHTACLPEKLLAVRSGLAEYGRNNVTYVQGLGSFYYLLAYFTDLPCELDTWRDAHRMKVCDGCTKCAEACPTAAISSSRSVIQAGRCLTMHNERNSTVPFPDFISPSAHNSLVGCMACQLACPMNAKQLDYAEGPVEFGEEETRMLLDGKPFAELPQATKDKLQTFDVRNYYEVVERNLKALFNQCP
jgi:epoxyqueuosine reductase